MKFVHRKENYYDEEEPLDAFTGEYSGPFGDNLPEKDYGYTDYGYADDPSDPLYGDDQEYDDYPGVPPDGFTAEPWVQRPDRTTVRRAPWRASAAGGKSRRGRNAGTAFLVTFLAVLIAGAAVLAVYAVRGGSGAGSAGLPSTLSAVLPSGPDTENFVTEPAEEAIPGTAGPDGGNGSYHSAAGGDGTGSGAAGAAEQDGSSAGGSGDSADLTSTASANIGKAGNGQYVVQDTAEEGQVTFAFAGDILFDGNYAIGATAWERGGIRNCFDDAVWQIMQEADVFFLNNEFPYSTRGTATAGKTYTFRANPDTASWLTQMGVDAVTLANNHSYDYGEEGLLDTLDTLDGLGLIHVGAGRNFDEASEPAVFTCDGVKIAVLNATQIEQTDTPDTKGATADSAGVFRCWDDSDLLSKISETKETADIVIVCIHWGTEKEETQSWYQTSRVEAMADAGADFVIGGHPHVLQGAEWSGDTFVFYSLGNYLFTSRDTDTGVLEITFDENTGETLGIRFVPMLQTNCSVTLLQGEQKSAVLQELQSKSTGGVLVDADGTITSRR